MSTVDNTNIVGTKTGPQLVTEIQTQVGNADTELDLRPEAAQTETIAGLWDFTLEVTFDAGIDVTASINLTTGDIVQSETADHTETPAAGKGQWWVKNDAPCVPMFTDDAGNDFQLGQGDNSAVYNNHTGTTYTVLASDNGKVITFNNAASIAVTLPDTLDTNFQFTAIQIGAGVPTITRSGTDTINGAATGVTPTAQWSGIYISQYAAGLWLALT